MNARKGKIVEKKGKSYLVQFEESHSCKGCSFKKACKIGGLKETWIEGEEDLELGDAVEVRMEESKLIFMSFIVFIVPILLFFLGYFVLQGFTQAIRIIGGIALLSLYFLFLSLWERKKLRHIMKPKIKKIGEDNA